MKRMHYLLVAALAVAAGGASADEIVIEVPGEAVSRQHIVYDCGETAIGVDYINAGRTALAVLDVEDGPLVMSNVIAASGARYAGDVHVWWTKGDEASLFDLTKGEDAPPVLSCIERPAP